MHQLPCAMEKLFMLTPVANYFGILLQGSSLEQNGRSASTQPDRAEAAAASSKKESVFEQQKMINAAHKVRRPQCSCFDTLLCHVA